MSVFLLTNLASGANIYVDGNGGNDGNGGTTWADAFKTLQKGLEEAEFLGGFDTIWVADGKYLPDTPIDRDATFSLVTFTWTLGGFEGRGPNEEGDISERDPAANETILSGDLDANDGAGFTGMQNNSYNVVTSNGNAVPTVIDGFTIRDGNMDLNDEQVPGGGGGFRGVNTPDSHVIRCVFTHNRADSASGEFKRNGGAMWVSGAGVPPGPFPRVKVINCDFHGNEAETGGALGAAGGVPLVFNTLFHDNETIKNGEGGAIFGAAELFNCTIVNNHADGRHGGIGTSNGDVDNCILWGNTGDDNNLEDRQTAQNSIITVMNSTIQGCDALNGLCRPGTTNDGLNPEFVDIASDWHLKLGSPAIDAGSIDVLIDGKGVVLEVFQDIVDIDDDGRFDDLTPDLDLLPRLSECDVDRGVYEHQLTCTGDTDGNTVVDIGDLLAVLSGWGSCQGACVADINCDDVVDFADLLLILVNWGACPASPAAEPDSPQEVIECMGLAWPDDWNEFLDNADDPNYRCWFDHYYYCHCVGPCPGFPNCSGADPFATHPH